MMTLSDQIVAVADVFAAATSRRRATVSTIVFNDGKRLECVAQGGDIGINRWQRAMRWFSVHWPEGAEWPEGVPRPEPRPAAHVEETAA
jgi:hypothetical protein